MNNKIDSILKIIWAALILFLTSYVIFAALEFFVNLNEKRGALYLNIACLISMLIIATFIVNMFIIPFALWIKRKGGNK